MSTCATASGSPAAWTNSRTDPWADLQRLPFTTKDDLRAAMDRHANALPHLCVPRETLVLAGPSAGTSGRQTYQAFDAQDLDRIAGRDHLARAVDDLRQWLDPARVLLAMGIVIAVGGKPVRTGNQ